MRICFLNHDLSNNTGTGRFFLSFSDALKKAKSHYQFEVINHGVDFKKFQ